MFSQVHSVLNSIGRIEFKFYQSKSLSYIAGYVNAAKIGQRLYSAILPGFTADLPFFILLAILLFWYSAQLASVVLAGILLVSLLKVLFLASSTQLVEAQISAALHENLVAIETIRSFRAARLSNMWAAIVSRYLAHLDQVANSTMLETRHKALQSSLQSGITTVTGVLVLAIGANAALQGSLSVGELVAFLLLKGQAENKAFSWVEKAFELSPLCKQADRLRELRDNELKMQSFDPKRQTDRVRAVTVSCAVNGFSYSPGKVILRDIEFTVPAGSLACIVAPSGRGKTTLLHIIGGLYPDSDAEIGFAATFAGDVQMAIKPVISGCFQDDILLTGTILQAVSWHTSDPDIELAQTSLQLSGATEFVNNLPDGLDTAIEEGGKNISLGQRQRLLLARAFYMRPQLLLLDEFSNHLDPVAEKHLIRGIRALGCTCIFASHSPGIHREADSTLEL